MSNTHQDIFEDVCNPIDSVEEIMMNRDWSFDRPTPDELMVHVTGRHGTYSLTFMWQEEYSAMQFFCEYDLFIPREREDMACHVLKKINENMWIGHFDLPTRRGVPCFRHTTMFHGVQQLAGTDHVHSLVEIAIAACERNYGVFDMLAGSAYIDNDLMNLALADSAGEA